MTFLNFYLAACLQSSNSVSKCVGQCENKVWDTNGLASRHRFANKLNTLFGLSASKFSDVIFTIVTIYQQTISGLGIFNVRFNWAVSEFQSNVIAMRATQAWNLIILKCSHDLWHKKFNVFSKCCLNLNAIKNLKVVFETHIWKKVFQGFQRRNLKKFRTTCFSLLLKKWLKQKSSSRWKLCRRVVELNLFFRASI